MDPFRSILVGASEAQRAYLARLAQLAKSDATVLLHGESGTGKDLSARALHLASRRAEGPLVAVSLAALAPSLVEAELFGHLEGAFTGARGSRLGRFRQAHGGTLVLDDADALPLGVQVKLVRVLQTRIVEPVGAEQGEPVDVRVICTSCSDLESEVQAGRFRRDLYFRVAVLSLAVPPLRARAEDIPLLAEHLLERLARERKLAPRPLTEAALARLQAHGWPGNVRELENALERVLALPPEGQAGAPIRAEELEFLSEVSLGMADELAGRALAHGVRLHELEQALLRRALAEQRGNVSAAARAVGLTRRAFEYRVAREQDEGAGSQEQPS